MRGFVVPQSVSEAFCALAVVCLSPGAFGQILNESGKLLPSDGTAGVNFGVSVSVSDGTAVVGTVFAESAYVFRWNGSSWTQEQKLLPSDGAPNDSFGFSVCVSGTVAVVGARHDDDNGLNSGSAYVFRFDPSQTACGQKWCEQQKLLPDDGEAGELFGSSVSVSGDVAIVGAYLDDDNGPGSGSAYVFRFDGSSWVQEQKLLASDGAAGDQFGFSLAVSDPVVIVAAWLNSDSGTQSGSAYAFRFDASQTVCGSEWCEEQKLLASDGAAFDDFGVSVSVSGNVALVGASQDDANGVLSGSAYVFRWNEAVWVEEQKLVASDGAAGDLFGSGVSVSGDVAIVGANEDDDQGDRSGSAYVFRMNGTSWAEQQKLLASDGVAFDQFGHSVCVSGGVALVGARFDDDNGSNSGAAYVFTVGGTCCISNGSGCDAEGNCQEGATQTECQALGGVFLGPNVPCATACVNGACIPAASAWGLAVLALVLLTGGTIALRRRVGHSGLSITQR